LVRSQAQFTQYYEEHFSQVYRYVYRRVGPGDADDVTSEVFTKAWRSFGTFRGPSFPAWIFRIAQSEMTDMLRRRGRTASPVSAMKAGYKEETGEPQALISGFAERVVTDVALAGLVQQLPDLQRSVVELRFYADLRHRDIARVLGKSEGAVKVCLQRALLRLHTQWTGLEEAPR
jgi:RNA polymerase sigma-70 factor (ECF subfamily)